MDIIVDIDGTVADCTHRLHFIQKKPKDWKSFFLACAEDKPIVTVVRMVHSLRTGFQSPGMSVNRIIFCSGRTDDMCRSATERWLLNLGFLSPPLYMRYKGDFRPDHEMKLDLLRDIRRDGFDPVLAIDDRKQVVDMWRREGLVCAQVAEGEF